MRRCSTITTLSVTALLAVGAGPAAARPADMPPGHSPYSSPAPVAHVAHTQIADDGIDWTDVGIGAGLAAALLLSAAGVTAVRRQPPMRVR